jgi:hypothetical protein
MSLTLNGLRNNRQVLTVQYAGETVEFTYQPGAVTPALGALLADPENTQPLVTALISALDSWNLIDDETGRPAIISPELLETLPTKFLNLLLSAIYRDIQPGK